MDYWQKQSKDKPLFEDILWSRPETRISAGKLLIVGGNSHGFAAVGQAYEESIKSGVGVAHNLLPESLRKTLGNILENTTYASSTPSGSFGTKALNELLIQSNWADGVLMAGDFGRNSEMSILIEKFINKFSGLITITKDAVDYCLSNPSVLENENICLVLNLSQLQKLGMASNFQKPFILGMGLILLVQALHDFTLEHKVIIITKELNNIVVANKGMVISSHTDNSDALWQLITATRASVFWLQNKERPLQAIASSLII